MAGSTTDEGKDGDLIDDGSGSADSMGLPVPLTPFGVKITSEGIARSVIPPPSIIRAQRRSSFSGATGSLYSHATSQRRVSFSGDITSYSHANSASQRRVSFSGDTASLRSHATGTTRPRRRVSFSGDTTFGGGGSSRDSSSPLGDSVQTPLGDTVQSHIVTPGSA